MSETGTSRIHAGSSMASSNAQDGLLAIKRATGRLHETASALDDDAVRGPSLLTGWTRGHLLTHVARNADGLVNLLVSAKTGVARPMYASPQARDADIQAGACRSPRALLEDLTAASDRFFAAAEQMPDAAWETLVKGRMGPSLPAAKIPWLRLDEVLIHLADLDCGADFDELAAIAGDQLTAMLDCVVSMYSGRPEVPAVELNVSLASGQVLSWAFGAGDPRVVAGPAALALSWLTGRSDGTGLTGEVPALPDWL